MMSTEAASRSRIVIGAMTGTSLDGLDMVAVRILGEGLEMTCEALGAESAPLGDLAGPLRALASGVAMPAHEIASLALRFGELHAQVAALLSQHVNGCDLCCAHGQTITHDPPVSWQLLNPWPIAEALDCPVVTDLRGADLACGGQGAPITPLADWVLFRDASEDRVIVNLGGFCNCTRLPAGGDPDSVEGFDVCACNQVIDAAARAGIDAPYDGGGTAALNGTINSAALEELLEALGRQSEAGRSLGTGDEAKHWIEHWRNRLIGDDLCATSVEGVARTIVGAVGASSSVYLAGGGVHNAALVRSLQRHLGREVGTTESIGVPPESREAACFAILGALASDGVQITLPSVTGASGSLRAGVWINNR